MGRDEGAARLTVYSCLDGCGQKDLPCTKETYLSDRKHGFRGKHQAAFCCRLDSATKYASRGDCEAGKADVYVEILGGQGGAPLVVSFPLFFSRKEKRGPAAA